MSDLQDHLDSVEATFITRYGATEGAARYAAWLVERQAWLDSQ